MLKDSKQADPELVKATLVLAYGHVTHFASKGEIESFKGDILKLD